MRSMLEVESNIAQFLQMSAWSVSSITYLHDRSRKTTLLENLSIRIWLRFFLFAQVRSFSSGIPLHIEVVWEFIVTNKDLSSEHFSSVSRFAVSSLSIKVL